MRKLVLIAAMLMASASAHAGSFSFNIEGQQVRVAIPRGCSSLSCINVTAPGLSDKFKDKDEDTSSSTSAPTTTATAPAAAPAPQAATTAPAAQAPATAVAPQASSKVTVLPAPSDTNATNATAPTVSAPEVAPQPALAPAQAEAQAPVQVAAAPAAPVAAPAPAAVQTATTPIGLWMTEKKEGKVRIEDCNGNLCGYAVDAKTGANGDKVLINMKPRGNQWAGRIHDTRKGGTYDSTIALRGSDKLKVQGCMMMFCGGETWTRIE